MSKFYLCSFADANMCASVFRFKNQAKNLTYSTLCGGGGVFDDVFIFSEDSLPLWFKQKFNGKMHGTEELNIDEQYKNWYSKGQIRGFGYWCWKPCVILEILKQIEYGDFLLYLDIGYEFCNGYDNIIKDMLKQVDDNDIMCIKANEEKSYEKYWNKMDFLRYFGLDKDDEFLNSPQVMAGLVMMKKTQKTLNIIQQWMDFFIDNFDLVSDSSSKLPNLPSFIEHRHDQSVLGVIMKKNKCSFFHHSYHCMDQNTGFPFLCNRNKLLLFSNRDNIITIEDSGFIRYDFPLSKKDVFIDINICDQFSLIIANDFKRMYNKRGGFLRKLFRMYYKFPKTIIRKYWEYANISNRY